MNNIKDVVLEIEDLTFGYTKEKILFNNFSITLKKSEILSIVGPSGSGKSTLFELISDELKPQKGVIKCKSIAQIYQDPYSSFHQSYTILNQIKDVADVSNIDLWLKKLSLEKQLLNKKPHQLSGGQLQRCSILRAVLMKPDLILADEPTSALDNVTQLEVMKLLITLLDDIAIVLITHDMNLAKWCSNNIIDLTKV